MSVQPKEIDIDFLKTLLDYNPDTGVFINKVRRANSVPAGTTAGSVDKNGYIILKIKGNPIKAHRAAFAIMTGKWPSHYMDHADGNKQNNRWSNLREANPSQSVHNRSIFKGVTKTGLKGAHWSPKHRKFASDIALGSKKHWIGYFDTAEEAHSAYCFMACEMHGEFANLG